MKLFMLVLCLISSWAMAQRLPKVEAPVELVSGDYTEGTMTRLTKEEIADFIPWAQNAQSQLTRGLKNAQSLPLRERLAVVERVVKSVINKSSNKQYQMFMRFALNRGLLLVSELQKNMDMNQIGAQENALDILQRSIQVSLDFYESDLNFQQRAAAGNVSVVLEYGKFGVKFMGGLYPGVVNVWDPGAQFVLLRKLVEMTNWDLSRDGNALGFADTIVEAYELLEFLPLEPEAVDTANLKNIRKLNSLLMIGSVIRGSAPTLETREQVALSVSGSTKAKDGCGAITPVLNKILATRAVVKSEVSCGDQYKYVNDSWSNFWDGVVNITTCGGMCEGYGGSQRRVYDYTKLAVSVTFYPDFAGKSFRGEPVSLGSECKALKKHIATIQSVTASCENGILYTEFGSR